MKTSNSGRTSISGKTKKSFFDYSDKEKKEILMKAAKESNKAQKELMDTQPKCWFCGEQATQLNYKPDEDYGMAYDLCDACADKHKKAWDSLKPTDQKPTWEDEFDVRFGTESFARQGLLFQSGEEVAEWMRQAKQFFKEVEKAAYERGKKEEWEKIQLGWPTTD